MDDSTANGTQAKGLTPYYRELGIPTVSYLSSDIPSPTMVVTPASFRAPSPTLSQECSSPSSTCSSSRPRPSSSRPSSMATLVASTDDTPIPSNNVAIPLTEIAGEDPQWELTPMSSQDILDRISERVDYALVLIPSKSSRLMPSTHIQPS
ncbi:hypothetical protein PHLCEN_2v8371 [Hermanssonia centrifuga]|uniref:Uncharacterized protein n=1 Tax=Hermanssonia centrifuga TaxID=98765 RepID=A0A2R6NTZ8_9APHY|nr:hypothetical protein PHLCEN_2v8371 [Hermanssonia centrifuga]